MFWIQVFQESELPLLIQSGLLNVTKYSNGVTKCSNILNNNHPNQDSAHPSHLNIRSNFTHEQPPSSTNQQNNTYKNNQIDNCEGAGGLAWLGYRLDMAGITCSNHVRPIAFKCFAIILKIFKRIDWKIINYVIYWFIQTIMTATIFSNIVTRFCNNWITYQSALY